MIIELLMAGLFQTAEAEADFATICIAGGGIYGQAPRDMPTTTETLYQGDRARAVLNIRNVAWGTGVVFDNYSLIVPQQATYGISRDAAVVRLSHHRVMNGMDWCLKLIPIRDDEDGQESQEN